AIASYRIWSCGQALQIILPQSQDLSGPQFMSNQTDRFWALTVGRLKLEVGKPYMFELGEGTTHYPSPRSFLSTGWSRSFMNRSLKAIFNSSLKPTSGQTGSSNRFFAARILWDLISDTQ